MTIPILDLKTAEDPEQRGVLLNQLRYALFNIGFLYITNHGVPEETISNLANRAPALFGLSGSAKSKLSKINSPHFLGYTGCAEEITQGKYDLREQFDFATELPIIYREGEAEQDGRDFSKLYWRLRGPNQWPNEEDLPGFKTAVLT
jgi:isopenicillin N synthase-like dioxygenase